MDPFQTFTHPYLGIYTKCFLWQTKSCNIWIDTGLRPGWDAMFPIIRNGKKNVLLLTHGHWDHIGGVALIRDAGGIVYGHAADRRMLTDLSWHWELLFGQFVDDFDLPAARKVTFDASVQAQADIDRFVGDGDLLEFDECRFRVITLPGHSAGSVCYLEEETGALFTGDGMMGKGFFTGTPQIECYSDYRESMRKITRLSPKLVITDHTNVIPGTELKQMAKDSLETAERMLDAVQQYAAVTKEDSLSVRDAAKAIAGKEGKQVGGGTCVSALAALHHMTEDSRARQCAQRYLFGRE